MHVWVRLRLFTALKALHSSALLGVEASLSCAVFVEWVLGSSMKQT